MKTVEIYFECNKDNYDNEKEKAISDFMAYVDSGVDVEEFCNKDHVTYIGNKRYHVCTWVKWENLGSDGEPLIEEVSKNGLQ